MQFRIKTVFYTNTVFTSLIRETHQEGLEPSTYRLEGDCSIQLSYWCKSGSIGQQTLPRGAETFCSNNTKRFHEVSSTAETVNIEGSGAGDEIRTRDIQLGRLSLYQLSYSRRVGIVRQETLSLKSECVFFAIDTWFHLSQKPLWSGRLDSNQRPPAPKAGALPDCATPRRATYAEHVQRSKVYRRSPQTTSPYKRRTQNGVPAYVAPCAQFVTKGERLWRRNRE